MDDLVSKLRRLDADRMPTLGDLNRAADRIEALEAERDTLAEMVLAQNLAVIEHDRRGSQWQLIGAGTGITGLTPDQAERFSAALTRLREETPSGE